MPYTPITNLHCWLRVAFMERWEVHDKDGCLLEENGCMWAVGSPLCLRDYCCDSILDLEIQSPSLMSALAHTVDWKRLLSDVQSDIREYDEDKAAAEALEAAKAMKAKKVRKVVAAK